MIGDIRHSHAIEAQCCHAYDSGVVIRGDNGEVQLLFRACPKMGAVLTPELAFGVTDALVKANARDLGGNSSPPLNLLFL